MNRTILITGGLGYLGGRIAAHLAGCGHGVVVSSRREQQLPPALAGAGIRLTRLDLEEPDGTRALPAGITDVIHLATPNEIVSGQDPHRAVNATIGGTVRLLHWAAGQGAQRFVFFSTAHVYGSPLVGHLTESSLPRPVHPYAIAHKAAEDFVLATRGQGSLDPVVVRLSNGFGAPLHAGIDRWSLLANDLCRQAVQAGRLVLKSSGLQVRDFVCISDVCRAVQHFLALPAAALAPGVFNLGSGCAITVLQMAERIRERCAVELGFCPEIVKPGSRSGEQPTDLRYDCSRLLDTGFRLTGDPDVEIGATLRLCRNTYGKA